MEAMHDHYRQYPTVRAVAHVSIMKRKQRASTANGATTLSIKPPPPRRSAIESEVAVPVLWSVLLAGSLAVAATLAALAVREVAGADWDWWLPLAAGGSTGVLVFAWRCIVCEQDRRALLLWPMETALGQDLDQDGYIGEPEQPGVEPVAQEDHRVIYVHDPYKRQHDRNAVDFRHFLKQAYGEKGTTWRAWDDEQLPSGRRVTRPLWDMWTGRLVQAGLATRDYPTAPLVLACDYRKALDTLRNVL